MSVNNNNQYTEVNNEIHGDYKFSDSSFVNIYNASKIDQGKEILMSMYLKK